MHLKQNSRSEIIVLDCILKIQFLKTNIKLVFNENKEYVKMSKAHLSDICFYFSPAVRVQTTHVEHLQTTEVVLLSTVPIITQSLQMKGSKVEPGNACHFQTVKTTRKTKRTSWSQRCQA